MTRHARNNTASAVYSYHERHKDTKTSGYGTQRLRLGKDSVKDFNACNLTLQPCRNPVITPEGFLYDKEAILEYFIHKKAENARKLKEYEKQKKKEQEELEELARAEQQSKAESFVLMEKSVVQSSGSSKEKEPVGSSISNMIGNRSKQLPSFWVPSMTPQSKKTKVAKPDTTVYCPMSGNALKVKDLIEVNFSPVNDAESSSSGISKSFKCSVTGDILNNSIPCAVLKTSGVVVTLECFEKLIKKEMIDPTNGKKLNDKDIIILQRGGTGYSSTNQLEAEVKRPVMMA